LEADEIKENIEQYVFNLLENEKYIVKKKVIY
jgi:hypothetical protein